MIQPSSPATKELHGLAFSASFRLPNLEIKRCAKFPCNQMLTKKSSAHFLIWSSLTKLMPTRLVQSKQLQLRLDDDDCLKEMSCQIFQILWVSKSNFSDLERQSCLSLFHLCVLRARFHTRFPITISCVFLYMFLMCFCHPFQFIKAASMAIGLDYLLWYNLMSFVKDVKNVWHYFPI